MSGMALTDSQTAYFDSQLGPGTWTEGDLAPRLLRLDDNQFAVAREVLEGRLAKMRSQPAQFSVSGEYSQGTAANITSLETQLKNIPGTSGDGGFTVGRLVRPSLRRRTIWPSTIVD
jgi:hypothetical protein